MVYVGNSCWEDSPKDGSKTQELDGTGTGYPVFMGVRTRVSTCFKKTPSSPNFFTSRTFGGGWKIIVSSFNGKFVLKPQFINHGMVGFHWIFRGSTRQKTKLKWFVWRTKPSMAWLGRCSRAIWRRQGHAARSWKVLCFFFGNCYTGGLKHIPQKKTGDTGLNHQYNNFHQYNHQYSGDFFGGLINHLWEILSGGLTNHLWEHSRNILSQVIPSKPTQLLNIYNCLTVWSCF